MSEVQTSTGETRGRAAGGGYGKPADGEPRALVVGHLTEDLTPDGPRLGGAAAYAGLLLARWGVPVRILTAADAGFPFLGDLAGIPIDRMESRERTRFENRYLPDGTRRQRLLGRADPIPAGALREAVLSLPAGSLAIFAPVTSELSRVRRLPRPPGGGAFAAAIPQGLLRRVDGRSRSVTLASRGGFAERLAEMDLVCLGGEEARAAGARSWLAEAEPEREAVLAVTRGAAGAALLRRRAPELPVPAVSARVVDPTGAGDVFAAALAFGLWRRDSPPEDAARLAAAAAALTVESPGTAGIPTRAEAAARLAADCEVSERAGRSRPG